MDELNALSTWRKNFPFRAWVFHNGQLGETVIRGTRMRRSGFTEHLMLSHPAT